MDSGKSPIQEKPAENGCADSQPLNQNTSFKEKLKNHAYRRKVWRTIWLGVSFLGLGFAIGQRGPAFLDLQIITQTDLEAASFFFTASSVGYLVGSLVAGVVYDKVNKSLLLLLTVLGMGLATIALPWCSPYAMMIAIHFIVSVFGGGMDTAGNAELVHIWGKEGEMAMQFLHFSFAFGGVIGPLATEPFLTPTLEDELQKPTAPNISVVDVTSNVLNISVSMETSNFTANSTADVLPLTTVVHYAYLISGSIILLVVIPLTVQLFTDRSEKRRQNKTDEKKEVRQPLPTVPFLFVLLTLCLFYFLYCCVEDTFASFLSTFVVKQLHWSKSSGAQLTSVYWASFATGRFLSIFVVKFLSSVKLLLLCSFSLFISMTAFLLLSQYGVNVGVWIASIMAGASMSAIFPTGFTWMEKELVRVTGRVTSSIMIASSSGTMFNPIVIGYLMQQLTPMWFAYLLLGQCLFCLCVFIFLLTLSRLHLQKHYLMHESNVEEIVIPSLGVEQSLIGTCNK